MVHKKQQVVISFVVFASYCNLNLVGPNIVGLNAALLLRTRRECSTDRSLLTVLNCYMVNLSLTCWLEDYYRYVVKLTVLPEAVMHLFYGSCNTAFWDVNRINRLSAWDSRCQLLYGIFKVRTKIKQGVILYKKDNDCEVGPLWFLSTATSSICAVSVKYMYLWMSLISTCVWISLWLVTYLT